MFVKPSTSGTTNPLNDTEVTSPSKDSVSALQFSPETLQKTFLISGSWGSTVRCWEVEQYRRTNPISIKTIGGPVLDICWIDDGSKVFIASVDKQVKCWDLASDMLVQVAEHDAPVRTCHWIKGSNYTCLMTGSWDTTLKFWDVRSSNPILTINLPERCYCADVDYPMVVVATASQDLIVYFLEKQPTEFVRLASPLKYEHRTISIFKDKKKIPTGYALGSIDGRVAIQYVNPTNPTDNFDFKCHRINRTNGYHDIYVVNDTAFHPVHGTLATVGSDGTFSFYDIFARKKLKSSEPMDQSITKCCFNASGHIFAYAVGYDWSKGYEYSNPVKKTAIFLKYCYEELKPRVS